MTTASDVLVGHFTDERGPTGVTVILLPEGTTGAVDVRGAAPGTRETDLLDPINTVAAIDAIVLSGGSSYGLASADGVMKWLEEQDRGILVGPVRVPIVSAAVIFDLLVGNPAIRPDAEAGRAACLAAVDLAMAGRGAVGAGAGATVAKLLNPAEARPGGVGIASKTVGPWTVSAVMVVNAMGDVLDPRSGAIVSGQETTAALLNGATHVAQPGAATTIGALITNASLTKSETRRLAMAGHDGLARSINPVHTPLDGDTLFAAATGACSSSPDLTLLCALAAEVAAEAVVDAVGVSPLIDAWVAAMADVRGVAGEVLAADGESGWRQPSLLPGWSIADVVAHLSWIERVMVGLADPPHSPDWSTLPHARSPFGRATEVPVDLRREWSPERLLAEFDDAVSQRLDDLRAGPMDPTTPLPDPFGRPSTLAAVLRMRTFDTWVHSQDIRLAIGKPGLVNGPAAKVSAEQIAGALGYVWAKRANAPEGAILVLEVEPPGISLNRAIMRTQDGRGVQVPVPADAQVAVRLRVKFDDFIQIGCGRTVPNRTLDQARAAVEIIGDQILGRLVIDGLTITP